MQIDGGLTGKAIEFPNLAATRIDVLVRVERSDGTSQVGRVLPLAPSFVVTASPGAFEVAQTYTVLGIEHILAGLDHLLFVLALLLLVQGTRRLIATITAFTVAHSLTLFAATLGWLNLPSPPVEAVIALSIVFLAGEIVHARQGRPGLTQRRPWIVAFSFGLLHGLGFAGALAEVGLPPLSIPTALLFFNVGVEIGQLIFIAVVLGAIAVARRIARRLKFKAPSWWWRVPPYAIGGIASFWLVQRVAAF
jgi:hydrogenase/urease accessory protein HupE